MEYVRSGPRWPGDRTDRRVRVGLYPMGFWPVSFEWPYLERSEASSGEFLRGEICRSFVAFMCPLICFSCSCRARETNSIVHAWSHGGSQIRGPGESSDRSVLHPWLARNPAAAREVDTHVSSILTIDPYRRDEESVSRLCHVHPEQGVDLECVTFEQGRVSYPAAVPCGPPICRPPTLCQV